MHRVGLTARDVMRAPLASVHPDDTLADLEAALLARRIGGAPVVRDGRLVGIVSRSDIVRVLSAERSLAGVQVDFYRSLLEPFDAPAAEATRRMEADVEASARLVAERMARLRVADAMVRDVVSVDVAAPLAKVARALVDGHIHRVVVTEGERPVGIVSTTDVVRLVADGRIG
jgi:CBS domain-containing protein